MINNKQRIILKSIVAVIFLTVLEVAAAIVTGSLGILSLALLSGLNLIAAIITFLIIPVADYQPDKRRNFGYGKIDNLTAFIKTFLQFLICIWIFYEAIHRLKAGNPVTELPAWSFMLLIASIITDSFRSRVLYRAPEILNCQAIEADARHFSTDIRSSSVILVSLIFTGFGFFYADSIAAIIIAFLVITLNFPLFKRSVEAVLDIPSSEKLFLVENALNLSHENIIYHSLKVRTSGADTFVSVVINLNPDLNLRQAHEICKKVEKEICTTVERCDVIVQVKSLNKKKIIL